MRLNGFVDYIIDTLENTPALSDVRVIKAYPDKKVRKRLEDNVIAVSYAKIDGDNESLDENEYSGEIGISLDIYTPLSTGSDLAIDIFSYACQALFNFGVVGISSEEITVDRFFSAYLLKTKITFNDKIVLGGEGNE